MGFIFVALSYVAGYIAILLAALSIACGLYYAAELAEEYTVLTGKILRWSVVVIELIHLLMLFDGFPFWRITVGALCHGCYALLLLDFPCIEIASVPFALSSAAVVVDHWVWFNYFFQVYHPVLNVMGFFLMMVWIVPFGFFVSLSVNDNVLPTAGVPFDADATSAPSAGGNSNLFKGLADSAMQQKDRLLAHSGWLDGHKKRHS